MGLGEQLVGGFGWANGFGFFLPPLVRGNVGIGIIGRGYNNASGGGLALGSNRLSVTSLVST